MGGTDPNDEPDEDTTANVFDVPPGTTVELDGFATHWEGTAPENIEDEQNPTLRLSEGGEYTFEWTNGDGVLHDLQIWDGSDNVVDDLTTDELNAEGETTDITFIASEEMESYACSIHPVQHVGDLVVE